LENKYVGESGKLVAAAFSPASKLQPCVLFFDEIDGMMRERAAEEAGSSYGLKTEFLMNLDRWQQRPRDAVVVIGSTNNARVLDPALKRRLPKTYTLRPPSAGEREHIIRLMLRREPETGRDLSEECLRNVLSRTEGVTGSDLREIYREAAGARLRRQIARPEFVRMLRERPSEDAIEPISKADWEHALSEICDQKKSADSNYCMREERILNDMVSRMQSDATHSFGGIRHRCDEGEAVAPGQTPPACSDDDESPPPAAPP
jgi:SpoVK/Ycf46/Vps4 family AAA+-type ATPase